MSELLASRSPENLDSSYQPARPGRVGGRGMPAEATSCRQAQSEGAHRAQGTDRRVRLEFGAEGGEQAKNRWESRPVMQAQIPSLKASKGPSKGGGYQGRHAICSDLGCSV